MSELFRLQCGVARLTRARPELKWRFRPHCSRAKTREMQLNLIFASLALTMAGDAPRNPALLMRPAVLNIGHLCRWDARCMRKQEQAMGRSVRYVRKYRPPAWKIQRCNRNASRGRSRVDWIGFGNCIRNPLVGPQQRKRRR